MEAFKGSLISPLYFQGINAITELETRGERSFTDGKFPNGRAWLESDNSIVTRGQALFTIAIQKNKKKVGM